MVFCIICGNELEEQWIICPNCGTSLREIDKSKQKTITPQQTIIIKQEQTQTQTQKQKQKSGIIVGCCLCLLGILIIMFIFPLVGG